MGACLCKSHKELQSAPQQPVTEVQFSTERHPIVKGSQKSSNGTLTDKKNGSGYNIGELATSSLQGLVATIKEHITKPTAMAQGRVAHLIEWKGWSSGAGTEGGGYSWGGAGSGWSRTGAGLQEDEQLYSHLTDEIKEARFAAGVAEQFALAEAAMSAWSNQDAPANRSGSIAPLQDPDGLFLPQFLLDGGDMGASQHLYNINLEPTTGGGHLFPPLPPDSCSSSSPWQMEAERPLEKRRTSRPDASIRHADSSSLSEDEVFYN
ncbi:protein FAM131C [Megalops cyprinoides]|uniref:protein FAM131C n=1 Tax=Megalops cyprinoides TaxID=118141 RepID=UPI001864592E|nr:protein FAM131C [Megalops cyprinoides]